MGTNGQASPIDVFIAQRRQPPADESHSRIRCRRGARVQTGAAEVSAAECRGGCRRGERDGRRVPQGSRCGSTGNRGAMPVMPLADRGTAGGRSHGKLARIRRVVPSMPWNRLGLHHPARTRIANVASARPVTEGIQVWAAGSTASANACGPVRVVPCGQHARRLGTGGVQGPAVRAS